MIPEPLTTVELRRVVERLPRVLLGHWPTPLDEVPRFAKAIGDVRIFIKRDDCTGFYFGGNKTRHNEFLMADAINNGCDLVVWGAELQSNNCRQTAAACGKLGIECRLFLTPGHHVRRIQGNLLLSYLVGASVEIVEAPIGPDLDALLKRKAEELKGAGRHPYVWDRQRVLPRSAVSYALCLAEIVEQCAVQALQPHAIYVSSAGATGAGLAFGNEVLGLNLPIRSIAPMNWPWNIAANLADIATDAAWLLNLPHRIDANDVSVNQAFVGEYGKPTIEGQEALNLLARTEGIMLDPVYSAKAMAALIAHIRSGHVPAGSSVIFIHTGGAPVIFAMADEMIQSAELSPHL